MTFKSFYAPLLSVQYALTLMDFFSFGSFTFGQPTAPATTAQSSFGLPVDAKDAPTGSLFRAFAESHNKGTTNGSTEKTETKPLFTFPGKLLTAKLSKSSTATEYMIHKNWRHCLSTTSFLHCLDAVFLFASDSLVQLTKSHNVV